MTFIRFLVVSVCVMCLHILCIYTAVKFAIMWAIKHISVVNVPGSICMESDDDEDDEN